MGGIDGSCIYKGSLVLYMVHDSGTTAFLVSQSLHSGYKFCFDYYIFTLYYWNHGSIALFILAGILTIALWFLSENYLSHARGLDYNLGYCAQVTGCPIPNLYNSCTVQMKKLRIFIFSSIMGGSEAKMLGVVDSECVFHVRCCYTWECWQKRGSYLKLRYFLENQKKLKIDLALLQTWSNC